LVKGALVASLSVGVALSADVALAGARDSRIDGDFVVQDSEHPGDVAVMKSTASGMTSPASVSAQHRGRRVVGYPGPPPA
jgi:hypothetical protein